MILEINCKNFWFPTIQSTCSVHQAGFLFSGRKFPDAHGVSLMRSFYSRPHLGIWSEKTDPLLSEELLRQYRVATKSGPSVIFQTY